MEAEKRREKIKEILKSSEKPVTASALAAKFSVSRQIIVGDVALLRAGGLAVTATPKGYVADAKSSEEDFPFVGLIACKHDAETMKKELYTIVDYGGTVIDVTVDHSVYGQLSGFLGISSRYDADLFLSKVKGDTRPLSNITGGIHLHHIGCKDEASFDIIKEQLKLIGVML